MAIDVHFTDDDWQRVRRDWSAFWAGELDRPLVWMERKDVPPGRSLPEVPGFVARLPMEMPAEEVVARYQAHLECARWLGDAFPKWWVNFGPGIMAGFLGSEVLCDENTVWFDPAEDREPAGLQLDYDADNRWWRRVQDLTRAAVAAWGPRVAVSHTDIGGNLDVLASLRTTGKLLLDLLDCPEQIDRLAARVTELWLRYYDEQYELIAPAGTGTTPWAPIWSPGRCYMLQSDFSYMISPEMFRRWVLPDLEACCERLDHGFYLLDGKGELVHLDMLLSIDRLRGIQWVPGAGAPEADGWMDLLARIRRAGKLCQVSVRPQGALRIVRELGGKGFILHVPPAKSDEDAADFLAALAREDAGRSGS